MTCNPRVMDLLIEWEKCRDEGRPVSPEDLCRDFPELLGELKRWIQDLEAVDGLIGVRKGKETTVSTPPLSAAREAALFPSEEVFAIRSSYRFLRTLDKKGGVGELFVVGDEDLRREVLVKRLRRALRSDPQKVSRFRWEAEVTSRLEHPGIVPIYGLGQDSDGKPFYAMRFVRGETLEEAVDRFHAADRPGRDAGERSLSLRHLLNRFLTVCNTVAYAHNEGVLHRDLKPANIMLGPFGETVALDWGLAKRFGHAEPKPVDGEDQPYPGPVGDEEGTQTGTVKGTPAYMSPEQAAGHWDRVGPASDIYSLGATLYMILTGRAPFDGRTLKEVLDKVQAGKFAEPRHLKKDIHRALEAICLKAMALKPEDRYGTASDLAVDLEYWLAEEPVGAWQEPWTVQAHRWLGRHRTLVTGAAVSVLVAVVSLVPATVLLKSAWESEREAKGIVATQRDKAQETSQVLQETVEAVLQPIFRTIPEAFPRDYRLASSSHASPYAAASTPSNSSTCAAALGNSS